METKHSRSPALRKLMWWKLNTREIQCSGSDKKPSMLETGTAKTNSAESSCGSISDSRRPPIKVGSPHPYGRKDILLTKSEFLYSLSFLISLNPCEQASGMQLSDSSRGYSPLRPKGSTICCALVAVAQVHKGPSVLNLLCAKDQANENCGCRSGI